ncbi:MAG: prevent-host-death family protein [Hydrococcus sp. SU_1_0]|nr:prevent-host-death family protein [Hydrococcus sp. SU_1_0]
MSQIKQVGIRNLKAKLSEHLNAQEPIAVTNNGRMIGIYLPMVSDRDEELQMLLEKANSTLKELIEE